MVSHYTKAANECWLFKCKWMWTFLLASNVAEEWHKLNSRPKLCYKGKNGKNGLNNYQGILNSYSVYESGSRQYKNNTHTMISFFFPPLLRGGYKIHTIIFCKSLVGT